MAVILVIVVALLLLSFGGVVLFGAPYLPTLRPQIHIALELANLKPGEQLLELGCGDGRVLIAAAKTGIRGVGYELNPILALIAWLRTRRFRGKVRIIWGNYWQQEWPAADAIFVFLLAKYMAALDNKIIQTYQRPLTLVSFAFEIPNKTADRERGGVFLYNYNVASPVKEGHR